MPEIEQEVKTFRKHYICDACGKGDMVCQHGITTIDTSWLHKCDECGAEEWFDTRYPMVVTRQIA